MSKKTTKKTISAAKKAVKNRNAKVRRDNARFEALKPAEKRVAIARDVLAQLASGRLKAISGLWLSTSEGGWELLDGEEAQKHKDTELQTVLKKMEKCTGCALGGMFMCAVERANKFKVRDLYEFEELSKEDMDWKYPADVQVDETDTFRYLRRFFSQEQLEMIESAFERGGGACQTEANTFCGEVEEPAERMRLVMQNIIVHKGKFVPEDKPVEVKTWTTLGFNEEVY